MMAGGGVEGRLEELEGRLVEETRARLALEVRHPHETSQIGRV